MFKHRFVQVLTVCFQLCLLAVLFVPIRGDYNVSVTLWDKIVQSYKTASAGDILTLSLYYLPVIITTIFVALFEGRFKYVLAAVSSSLGLTITLVQFIFPAVSDTYLFYIYQVGLYILISIQVATVILCVVGVSLKRPEEMSREDKIDTKSDTQELLIEDIKTEMNKTGG